jgi:hypothetical protein
MLARLIARGSATLFAVATLLSGAAAYAQSSTTVSMTVSPLVLEFHAAPGVPASANVTIRNNGTAAERITAQRMDWRTTPEGTIKIEPVGTEGASSIANYLRLSPEDVVLAPGESREFALTLDLPANFPPAAGVYWGGFFIRAVPATGTAMFGPAATVVVYNTVGTPRTHVKLTQLRVEQAGIDGANVVAHVLNDGVGYARPQARIVVTQDGRVIRDQTENMPVIFAGAPRVYTKALTGLPGGSYELTVTIDYGGATLLEGTTSFRIR